MDTPGAESRFDSSTDYRPASGANGLEENIFAGSCDNQPSKPFATKILKQAKKSAPASIDYRIPVFGNTVLAGLWLEQKT